MGRTWNLFNSQFNEGLTFGKKDYNITEKGNVLLNGANMAYNSVIESDFAVLGEIIRAEYRQRRARKLVPIWPAVMKILPFPEFRLKLVNFLLNFALDFEMKIH